MKTNTLSAALLAGLLFTAGCSSKTDSKEVASDANDQKIETNTAAGTPAMTAESAGGSKDVADYMVNLASTGLTEFELSKLAAARTTNPAVKAFASKAVAQHAQDEQALKAQAATYNITLPTTLSDRDKVLVKEMSDEKTGAGFDNKYLDYMADVNDKALVDAKSLVKSTNKPELKAFVDKIIQDDEQHLGEATKLRTAQK